jgi:LmbE family N-acetylglucosaminyl deacetylase
VLISPRRVLVLAPHTDDAELGCGATMVRWIDEGAEVFTAVFSSAEASLPAGSAPGRLRRECALALDQIGVPAENRFLFDYPVREFGYRRQDVLEDMVRLSREVGPDVVLTPAGADLHQDHAVIHQESLRAFRHGTLMGYELPWNHITFSTHAFVVLTEDHLLRKWKALAQYASQLELGRPYFRYEAVEAMARVRGMQVRSEYAEAYEMIRIRL